MVLSIPVKNFPSDVDCGKCRMEIRRIVEELNKTISTHSNAE
jgi:hypothetical protein